MQDTSLPRNKTEHFPHPLKLRNKVEETFQIQMNSISKYVSISPSAVTKMTC